MVTYSYWIMFFSAALAIAISPGPDMLYILSKTIAQGRRTGFLASLGVCSGAMVHVFFAAFGLSVILTASALAFSLVKYAGAGYLLYLGIKALLSKGTGFDMPLQKEYISPWNAFRQGVLVDILNPKVAVFFMAFLPQFVRPEIGHTSFQIVGLGLLVLCVSLVIEFLVIFLASQTTAFFRGNRRYSVWLDRMMGSVLIALGVRLALLKNGSD